MKIVREHINEKFEADSDPIDDMGIGSKWKRLKKGDILISKSKEENMSLEDSRFFSYKGVNNQHVNNQHHLISLLQCSVIYSSKYDKDIIYLDLIRLGGIKFALLVQDNIIRRNLPGEGYSRTLVSAPIELWDKYFDIYDENS